MSDIDPTWNADAYVAHSEWVRRLARRLLEDEGAAEDVAQETWAALLRQPAGTVRDLRAWLSGVTRKLALRSSRDRSRRTARTGEEVEWTAPSEQDVLETEAARKQVIDAVLALDEPYRSTVLLHFYDELTSEEIARRLDVPSSTVRARLRRGLERLRATLDARDVREDRDVRSALLLVARGARPISGAGKGILLAASVSSKVAVGTAVLVGILFVLWIGFLRKDIDSSRAPTASAVGVEESEPRTADLKSPIQPSAPGSDRTSLTPVSSAGDERWQLRAQRVPGIISGTVIRRDEGRPIGGARIRIATSTGDVARNIELADDRAPIHRETTTSADGRFRFEDIPSGPYALRAEAADDLVGDVVVAATAKEVPVLISLRTERNRQDRIAGLSVRVRDVTRMAVEGADVEFIYRNSTGTDGRRAGTTNASGEVDFTDLGARSGVVIAHAADGRIGCVFVEAGRGPHGEWSWDRVPERVPAYDLVIDAPGSITGHVRGGPATVHAWFGGANEHFNSACFPLDQRATCAADGRFEIRSVPPGSCMITVDAPPGMRADVPIPVLGGSLGHPARIEDLFPTVVKITAGETTTVEINLVPAASVHGRVVDHESGRRIPGAQVRAWVANPNGFDAGGAKRNGSYAWGMTWRHAIDEWTPSEWKQTRTDEKGEYSLSGLDEQRAWVIEVLAKDMSRDLVDPCRLEAGATLELEHCLVRAGGIQGVAWPSASLGFVREGETDCCEAVGTPYEGENTFTVAGLRPGRYTIVAIEWLPPNERAPITAIDVRAGEISWVDLRESAPNSADVRITFQGTPVAGAMIEVTEPQDQFVRAITDTQGRCSIYFPFAMNDDATLRVFPVGIADAVANRFKVQGMLLAGRGHKVDLALAEGTVEVDVHGSDGTPCRATATLSSVWKSGPKSPGPEPDASTMRSTDASGHVRFAVVPIGRYSVVIEGENGWLLPPREFEMESGGSVHVELEAPATGSLVSRVLDAGGHPMEHAQVAVVDPVDDKRSYSRARTVITDAEGMARFPAVTAGPVRVTALTNPHDFSIRGYVKQDMTIEAGEQSSIVLRLP